MISHEHRKVRLCSPGAAGGVHASSQAYGVAKTTMPSEVRASFSEVSQARGIRRRHKTLQAKIRSKRAPAILFVCGARLRACLVHSTYWTGPERMKSMTSTRAKLQRSGRASRGMDAQHSLRQRLQAANWHGFASKYYAAVGA